MPRASSSCQALPIFQGADCARGDTGPVSLSYGHPCAANTRAQVSGGQAGELLPDSSLLLMAGFGRDGTRPPENNMPLHASSSIRPMKQFDR